MRTVKKRRSAVEFFSASLAGLLRISDFTIAENWRLLSKFSARGRAPKFLVGVFLLNLCCISHAHGRRLYHFVDRRRDGVQPFDAQCCHLGTAIKHPVPDRVRPLFAIFDIRALRCSWLSVRVPGCQKLLNPVWHRMLHSCTHMATLGIKGLILDLLRFFPRTRYFSVTQLAFKYHQNHISSNLG